VLKKTDTAAYALSVMGKLKVSHLPLLAGGIYQCLLPEDDLQYMRDPEAPVGESFAFAPSINESEHLYEAVARMLHFRLTVLPVVTPDGRYCGVLTRDKVFEALAGLCQVETPGSLLVIELSPMDYALSDIARIVEAHDAHLLSLLSHIDTDSGQLILVLKVDLEDATPLVRSFERFHYKLLYHCAKDGIVDEVLLSRLNEALYYMNM
jgi:CBS domain-containing protein